MVAMQKERLRPLTVEEQRELTSDREGEQRACGSGEASEGAAGGGRRGDVRGGVARGWLSEHRGGHVSGAAVQSGRAGRTRDRGSSWAAADVRRGGASADRGDRPAATGSESRWHGDVVALDPGADGASGGAPARGRDDDPAGAARRGQFVPADADLVPDGDGPAEAQGGRGAGGGSADGRKRGPSSWRTGEPRRAASRYGARTRPGPYQAIPSPGPGWAPVGEPATTDRTSICAAGRPSC